MLFGTTYLQFLSLSCFLPRIVRIEYKLSVLHMIGKYVLYAFLSELECFIDLLKGDSHVFLSSAFFHNCFIFFSTLICF